MPICGARFAPVSPRWCRRAAYLNRYVGVAKYPLRVAKTDAETSQSSMPDDAARQRFLRRLERLARQLKGGQWASGQDLWDWQVALLDLQREIQGGITSLKGTGRNADQQALLDWLKDIRWHARRLGDAFAWVVLGLEMRVLHSLAENDRVPVSVEDHGSRGMTMIAAHLADEGWGFPVLHDVTDCLRIGDITFVDVTTKPRTFRTVEVKTRVTGERPTSDGKTEYTYQVQAILHFSPGEVPSVDDSSKPEELTLKATQGPPQIARGPSRLDRQMRRMSTAIAKQNAIPGEVTDIPGQDPLLTTDIKIRTSAHWKELRRVIRKARTYGYASEPIDGALIYLALYRKEGLTAESINEGLTAESVKGIPFAEEIERSGIFDRATDRFPNSLVVHGVPPNEDRGGIRYFLPHFLYSIPHRAISDLLHHRLAIIVLSNPGKLVDAIEAVGLKVSNRSGVPDLEPGSIVATHRFEDASGGTWHVELHNLNWHIFELIYEFKSIQHLVAVALSTCDVAQKGFAELHGIELLNGPPNDSEMPSRPK